MKLKTKTGSIQLGEWTRVKERYWFRLDTSELKTNWSKEFGHNNAVGFLVSKSTGTPYCVPRFFGEDVKFLIEEWNSFNQTLSSDVEKAKETMDVFLQLGIL